jgi:MYXO-CTERM domain-containing protein
MTKHLTGGLAAAFALLPAVALAHPGHAAPASHSHWELAAVAALALALVTVLRRTRQQ